MDFKKIANKFILRIDRGEEILTVLKKLCTDQGIKLGSVTGIGAVNRATLGVYEVDIKKYHSIELTGDYEIAPLTGNISTMNGEVYIHIHACLFGMDNKCCGGHLNYAVTSATSEIIIDAIDGCVDREYNDDVGLNLYKFI